MFWCIYRITNLINGKTYIGQHKYKKLNDSYMGSGVLIKRAIKKHGIKNFKKEILYSRIQYRETADDMERFAIAKERAISKAEYNLTDGGEGGSFKGRTFSEESRKKMSESHKGIPLSEEHRKSMRGRPAWNKGMPCSEETKRKISETNKGNPGPWEGKQLSEETKRKISEAHKGKHWKLIDGKRVYY